MEARVRQRTQSEILGSIFGKIMDYRLVQILEFCFCHSVRAKSSVSGSQRHPQPLVQKFRWSYICVAFKDGAKMLVVGKTGEVGNLVDLVFTGFKELNGLLNAVFV